MYSKKHFIVCFLALTLLLVFSNLAAHSAASLSLAGSYSLRATGCEANYWNPANLVYPMDYRFEVLIINSHLSLNNNALSIKRYNEINGSYLTDRDKQKILSDLDKSFSLKSTITHNLVGVSTRNIAFSGRLNFFVESNLSSRYVELILYGNEYDKIYKFTRDNNNLEILSYTDLTIGLSPYSFYLGEYEIHTGLAFSLLGGLVIATTDRYQGQLHASDDGVSLKQDITIKMGTNGYGMKGLIGFRSDINENLSLGLSVDNLAGYIYWTQNTEKTHYSALIDSVYVNKLDKDIFEHSEVTEEIDSFTTNLPVYTRMSALYRLSKLNFSLDWKQGFTNSVVTNKTPDISMGTEYYVIPQIPLRMGYNLGLGTDPYSLSYGFGVVMPAFDIDLGIKSIGSLIPGSYSRGIAFAITSKIRF